MDDEDKLSYGNDYEVQDTEYRIDIEEDRGLQNPMETIDYDVVVEKGIDQIEYCSIDELLEENNLELPGEDTEDEEEELYFKIMFDLKANTDLNIPYDWGKLLPYYDDF